MSRDDFVAHFLIAEWGVPERDGALMKDHVLNSIGRAERIWSIYKKEILDPQEDRRRKILLGILDDTQPEG